ncbi:hypothetical protein ACIO3O_41120 [Streptomyces sp. NPDC087440]|uniref:hypothetical protein n=1 Tax=Streptomyces sp. NPDC087440 TaxID=3365790 RepID=UPI00382931B5
MRVGLGVFFAVMGAGFVLFSTRITRAEVRMARKWRNEETSRAKQRFYVALLVGSGALLCAGGIWIALMPPGRG